MFISNFYGCENSIRHNIAAEYLLTATLVDEAHLLTGELLFTYKDAVPPGSNAVRR